MDGSLVGPWVGIALYRLSRTPCQRSTQSEISARHAAQKRGEGGVAAIGYPGELRRGSWVGTRAVVPFGLHQVVRLTAFVVLCHSLTACKGRPNGVDN
jgi:hypothetical protein